MEGEQENLRRAEQDAIGGQAHKNDTEEALLKYVRQCAEERGKSPRMRDVQGGTYISQRFGSWALVLTLAGLKLPRGVEPPSQRTINAYQKSTRRKHMGQEKKVTIEVNDAERQVIQLIRDVGFGQIIVTVKENKAVHIEERKSILIKSSK